MSSVELPVSHAAAEGAKPAIAGDSPRFRVSSGGLGPNGVRVE